MSVFIERRRRAGLVAVLLVAALFAVMGLAGTPARAAAHVTLTEEDYFTGANQVAGLTAYNAVFERAHPGVTIKREAVAFTNLDAELLTQAGAHDLPNILATDNPFVAAMVATGQILPLNKFKGFSTKGYYPAVIDEGLIGKKNYSLPVAGENSIALIYNIADFKAANTGALPEEAQSLLFLVSSTDQNIQNLSMSVNRVSQDKLQLEAQLHFQEEQLPLPATAPAVNAAPGSPPVAVIRDQHLLRDAFPEGKLIERIDIAIAIAKTNAG